MKRIIAVLFILAAVQLAAVSPVYETPEPAERKLHELINQYRADRGLSAIKLSKSLTYVAEIHAADLEKNVPTGSCNMHSWSGDGKWTSCCYTSDHAKAACMWNKPREMTTYTGNGYECSSMHSSGITPETALSSWKGSSGHNAVIISQGIWASHPWKSIGVGIKGKYAVIWFGEEEDPAGYWE